MSFIPKPKCYLMDDNDDGFIPVDKILMIPGPTNLHPKVLRSLSTPLLSHTDEQFYRLQREIQDGIRYLFQTRNRYTFALTGSATLAMETCIVNLLQPGQMLLSLNQGYWGKRVASMGVRLGFPTHSLRPLVIGDGFTLKQIESTLRMYRPNLMYVCHGDSSLCSVQCLDGMGKLCHKYGCLLMVDAVVTLCSTPLAMDQMEIDVLFSGAQKALSGPPGISLISFSDRAMQAIRDRAKICPAISFYMDIELVAKQWGIDNNGQHSYHFTPAINLMYGLRAAIKLVVQEGLQNIIQRHFQSKQYLEKRLQQIGLEFFIKKPENRLAGITAVLIPPDINGSQVMQFIYNQYGVLIGGSLLASDKTIPNFWRIGYLGVNADKKKIDLVIQALTDALKQQHKNILKAHL